MHRGEPQSESMGGHQIRPARPIDAPVIAALVQSADDLRQVSPTEGFPLSRETVLHWILDRQAGFVLEERGQIVAYAELVQDADVPERFWVGHMIVHPRRRGLGLGRRLVATLLRIAEKDRDAKEVAISAFEDNPRAISCYESCGFRRVGSLMVHARKLVDMRYPIRSRRHAPTVTEQIGAFLIAATVAGFVATEGVYGWMRTSPLVVVPFLAPIAAVWWGRQKLAEVRDPIFVKVLRGLLPVILGAVGMIPIAAGAAFFMPKRAPWGALSLTWFLFLLTWSALTVVSLMRTRGVTRRGSLPTHPAV